MVEVKWLVEKWEIWDEKEKTARSEEVNKLILPKFHKWIKVFGEMMSEWMLMKKI